MSLRTRTSGIMFWVAPPSGSSSPTPPSDLNLTDDAFVLLTDNALVQLTAISS